MSCNFTIPGVEAFAYDLVAARGPVSSRVALLLRSTEGKPSCALAFFERNLPSDSLALLRNRRGGINLAARHAALFQSTGERVVLRPFLHISPGSL